MAARRRQEPPGEQVAEAKVTEEQPAGATMKGHASLSRLSRLSRLPWLSRLSWLSLLLLLLLRRPRPTSCVSSRYAGAAGAYDSAARRSAHGQRTLVRG